VTIHKQTDIHPTARLGQGASVAAFTTIGPNVQIGDQVEIGPGVFIGEGTVIGDRCRIYHGASVGGDPQIMNFKDVPSGVEIGPGTTIREYVTIHRGGKENSKTVIGQDCMLMNYVHIAHDCDIGNQVIIVNNTGLSGHVIVEERAFISGLVGVHQFVRIGKNAMVGGMAGIGQDVLPFSMVEGKPARLISTNAIGLKRSNLKPEVRAALKKAIKIIRLPELNTGDAIKRIQEEIEMLDEIRYLIHFIENSSRGITK
jgi:UDP-N-acetylglucosamine acyltransferase